MLFVVLFYIVFFTILLFLILFSVFVSGLIYSILSGAPYVPTSKRVIQDILKQAKFKKGMKFLELGCGTGRIVSEAVEKYGVNGVGVEINPVLYAGAKFRNWITKLEVEFIRKDVRKINFKEYDVIYLYLFPALIEKIQNKFIEESKKGTVVISHGFRIPVLEKKLFDTLEGHTFKTFYYKV